MEGLCTAPEGGSGGAATGTVNRRPLRIRVPADVEVPDWLDQDSSVIARP